MMRRNFCVLLVEDRDADAALIRRLLERQQITTERVSDAQQALAYLHGNPPYADRAQPDLLLVDLGLPGANGHELIRRIRADDRWHSAVIIVLTASEDKADFAEAYRAFANSVLVKPIELADFKQMLADLIGYWAQWNQAPP
jgi:CheY-like chemotaxis protein